MSSQKTTAAFFSRSQLASTMARFRVLWLLERSPDLTSTRVSNASERPITRRSFVFVTRRLRGLRIALSVLGVVAHLSRASPSYLRQFEYLGGVAGQHSPSAQSLVTKTLRSRTAGKSVVRTALTNSCGPNTPGHPAFTTRSLRISSQREYLPMTHWAVQLWATDQVGQLREPLQLRETPD